MTAKQLKLAPQKSEVVLLAAGRKLKSNTIELKETNIRSQESVKYLGIHMDQNMKMGAHVRKIAEKAGKTISNTSRIMPNIGGPREGSRRMICSVAQSIMRNDMEKSHGKKVYRNVLLSVQRRAAIKIACAYKTTSTKALLMIARTPLIDLLAEERTMVQNNVSKGLARLQIMEKWQQFWEIDDGKANWTKR
nr:uncharacterized protein LOC111506728 [Leptinotarsa decemlineata]